MLGQVKSGKYRLGNSMRKTRYFRFVQFSSGYVRLCRVRSGNLRL